MLKPEDFKSYEYTVGKTVYTIESVTSEDTRLDIIDAMVSLVTKDIEAYHQSALNT